MGVRNVWPFTHTGVVATTGLGTTSVVALCADMDALPLQIPPKQNMFLPLGSGVHSCLRNELAKLDMLILIHNLTTKYRWDVVGTESSNQYGPFHAPKQGLPVKSGPRWKNLQAHDPPHHILLSSSNDSNTGSRRHGYARFANYYTGLFKKINEDGINISSEAFN